MCRDGEAAIEWIRTSGEQKRRPDLGILDLNLHKVLRMIERIWLGTVTLPPG